MALFSTIYYRYRHSGCRSASRTCIEYLSLLYKSVALCLYLLLPCHTIFAQQISLWGFVHSSKLPLERASVVVYAPTSKQMLGYTYTDSQGQFKISLNTQLAEVLISVRHMGYKAYQKQIVVKDNQHLVIDLEEEMISIEEVVVHAPSVWRQQDTISYSVPRLSRLGDRSIADVIRHIPGIRIQGERIEYQGKALKQIYIEGVDLSQGDYSLLMRNIDATDIATIQVLDNHQSIRALVGKQSSDDVILNLKLSSKRRGLWGMSLDAGLGYGAGVETNTRLRSSYFARRLQLLGLAYADNTGRLNYQNVGSNSLLQEERPIFARVEPVGAPSLPSSYYLDNTSLLFSGNSALINPDSSQFHIQSSYRYDQIQSEGRTDAEYLDEGSVFSLYEGIERFLKRHQLLTNLSYEKNLHYYYLKDRLQVSLAKQSSWGRVRLGEEIYPQQARLENLKLSNQWHYVYSKKRLPIEVLLKQQLYCSEERFISENVQPLEALLPLDKEIQQINQLGQNYSFQSDNHLRIPSIRLMKFVQYRPQLYSSYHCQRLGHSILSEHVHSSEQMFRIGIEQALNYRNKGQELELSFPISYQCRWYSTEKLARLLLEPRLKLKLNLDEHWTMDLQVRYTNSEPNLEMRYPHRVIRGYRLLTQGTPTLYREGQTILGGQISYRSIFAFFSSTLKLNHSMSDKPFIQMLSLNERGGQFQLLEHKHRSRTSSVLWSSSKGWGFWGLGLDLDLAYTKYASLEAYQNLILPYAYHSTNVRLGLKATPIRSLLVDYSLFYGNSTMRGAHRTSETDLQCLQTLRLGYNLSKHLYWDILAEYKLYPSSRRSNTAAPA